MLSAPARSSWDRFSVSLGVDELPGRLRSEIWLTLRTQGLLKRRGWRPETTCLGAVHSSLPPPGGRTSPVEEKPVSGAASRPGYPGWAVSSPESLLQSLDGGICQGTPNLQSFLYSHDFCSLQCPAMSHSWDHDLTELLQRWPHPSLEVLAPGWLAHPRVWLGCWPLELPGLPRAPG